MSVILECGILCQLLKGEEGEMCMKKNYIHLLDIVYGLAVIVCLYLTFTSESLDIDSITINGALFIIVFWIFFKAKKTMKNIVAITQDLKNATQKITTDFELEQKYLWEKYNGENGEALFQNDYLVESYKKYTFERNRLASISDNKYKCDVCDYINEEMIDAVMKKNVYNLVPGVMTGLGILGTFVGLSFGLQNFNTGNTEEIEASIAPLMNGIKVAFHTSIYGMLFSLIFNYVYKETLEDAYIAVDEFLKVFDNYVDSNASDNNDIVVQMLLQKMPKTIGESIANILSPAVDRMNETLENLTNNMASNQLQGLSEIVDHFVDAMDTSMGDSFKALGETIDKTIEMQTKNSELMNHILDEIQGMTQNIIDINTLSNQTVEHMAGYIENIESLQKVINENFTSINIQLEYQKEYDDKLKEYIDILVNYERQIGEASNRFTEDMSKQLEMLGTMENKISESTRENLEMLATKADEYNKSLTDVAKQELQIVLSMAGEYSEKVTGHLNALGEMSEKLTEESVNNLHILSDNAQQYNESLSNMAKQELESVHSMTGMYSEKVTEHLNELRSMSVKITEESNNNLRILSSNAQVHNKAIADEAEKQIDAIIKLSHSQTGEMDRASQNLAEVSKGLNDKLTVALNNAFTAIDENLAEITRHLSGTISEIEETTDRVPQVVQASYSGMKDSFDEMKQKYEALIRALDIMAQTLEQYQKD